MMFNNEIELRNLFKFLSDKNNSTGDKTTKESILYGLENYALDIPSSILKDLTEKVMKEKNDYISFDEFKRFWISNINTQTDTQKFAQQTMHLIRDKISNKYTDESQITLEGIEILLQKMEEEGLLDDKDKDKEKEKDKDSRKPKGKMTKERRRQLAKRMIEAIDLEGNNSVGLVDFEFLIENYLNSLKMK